MIEEQLYNDLFNKIPNNSRIILFGACEVAKKILNDIKKHKSNVKILGFIENKNEKINSYCNLPVWTLKKFLDTKIMFDYIVMTTLIDYHELMALFDLYNLPVIPQTKFISNYYRNVYPNYNDENYNNIINMFSDSQDKELYSILFKLRLGISDFKVNIASELTTHKLYNGSYTEETKLRIPIKEQYIEKINKDNIETLFDCGLYTGLNVLAYDMFLPNLKKVIGFEAIYNVVKERYIEDFLPNNKLKIVPYAVGEEEGKTSFAINTLGMSGSYCPEMSSSIRNIGATTWNILPEIDVITLNKYCRDNNIFPDLIKMDIEGAELPALKGGIDIIKQCRPQLAISIYHSNEDYINIPLYLKENLVDYTYKLGHYSPYNIETVLYAIPNELI